MFTATVTRALVNVIYGTRKVERLSVRRRKDSSIVEFFAEDDFDFLGNRKAAFVLSAVLMVGSLVLLIPGSWLNFGIDSPAAS
jgi:hypothetical protein